MAQQLVTHGAQAARDPVLAALERIERRLDRIEAAIEPVQGLVAQAPGVVAMAVDTFDTWIARLQAEGVDVDDHIRNLLGALSRLTSPEAVAVLTDLLDHVDELRFLLQSGVLSRPAVAVIGQVGGALSDLAQQEPPRAGAFAALRALGDPDVQRALGFAIQLAQHFGKARAHLEPAPAKALPEGASS